VVKIILFHIHAIGEAIDHPALTRIPCAEDSNAAAFVNLITARFDAL
jgi:hypothetical protein